VPTFRYVVIDVFTDTPLTGNQLAVFTDAREIPEDMLQDLAREMAFSETVFVYPPRRKWPQGEAARTTDDRADQETVFVYPKEADGHARIRIYTPNSEIPFAGHPTLGTAFVLAAPMELQEIHLETGAGTIPVRLEREGPKIVFGWMRQPIPTWKPYEHANELLAALDVEESLLPVEVYDNGMEHVYVMLGSEDAVAGLRPDLGRLSETSAVLGINCFAGSGLRWKTRMFAPGAGVWEDPATGSAAGPLAVHVARHGKSEFGEEIEITQGAEINRPSKLHARVEGSPDEITLVEVGGSAVTVAHGEFRLR
jgi:trans-2,3-dihydro-3-hydroxyanthranilate isomerase